MLFILSFEGLHKKKAGPAVASVPPKAAASPRNVPEKPPVQAPKTNLQEIKKAVQQDKKEMAKAESKKEKPAEPILMKKPLENKEKPSPVTPHVALDKPGRKSRQIEES